MDLEADGMPKQLSNLCGVRALRNRLDAHRLTDHRARQSAQVLPLPPSCCSSCGAHQAETLPGS